MGKEEAKEKMLLIQKLLKYNLKISYIIKFLKFMYGNEINTECK